MTTKSTPAEKRFNALREISLIWNTEDGDRTDVEYDFALLFVRVQDLRNLGRSPRWQSAIDKWVETITRAWKKFCDENEYQTTGINEFATRNIFGPETRKEYDQLFTWALTDNTYAAAAR